MIETLNLPQDRFNQPQMTGLKLKNFIFGKNGTGKSSITQCIKEQYFEDYDIRIFQGYEQILSEQGKLNLISLGVENVKLQPEIEKAENEIRSLEAIVNGNIEDPNSLVRQINQQNKIIKDKEQVLDRFYIDSAKKFKNNELELFGPTYNKTHFKRDIENRCKVSDNDVSDARKNVSQRVLEFKKPNEYSYKELITLVDSVNEVLLKEIAKTIDLEFDNQQEKQWVEEGITLHSNSESCLFCGQLIPENRKEALSLYFNDAVNKLNREIISQESVIKSFKEKINNWAFLEKGDFLTVFETRVNSLNAELGPIKKAIVDFVNILLDKLEEKRENLFLKVEPIEIFNTKEADRFVNSYKNLYDDNIKANNNLASIQKQAKNVLINDLVFRKCEEFGYSAKKTELDDAHAEKNKLLALLSEKKQELSHAKKKLQELKIKTVDESLAAEYINSLIKGLGNESFSLKKSKDDNEGNYVILDYQNKERNIDSLSTGEKNIIAFLWFIYNLSDVNSSSEKDKVIVFDDPMNSNDDTTQYLIISKLQELLSTTQAQIFILTHNAHFYINTRYKWWDKGKTYKATYRLVKNGTHSDIILVETKDDDIKTSYDALWKELQWLYSNGEPEYLLNPIRRILETYTKFNCISDTEFYKDSKEAEKLFNVNSHAIDDLEHEPNGKNKREIILLLKKVFEDNDALNHFEEHFGPFEN